MREVVIIGSGPAGLTAAIYAARGNLKPLLIEGELPGGQLMTTTDVENYPGFPEGILGPDLMEMMKKQAQRFGTECLYGNVTSVNVTTAPYTVTVEEKDRIETKTVIIATGARARLLGLESEKTLMGRGVSTCATCDGYFYREKKVAVVGGGDSAMEEANFLTKFATEVIVIHRRDSLRASKIMQERVLKNSKIKFLWDSAVIRITGNAETGVQGIHVKNLKSNKEQELKVDGIFIAIGHEPNTALFKGQLELDAKGYIITRDTTTATNRPGVFACGDVQDPRYRQAATAAGAGCMAALDAEKYLA